jgi:hypothetical protein
MMVLMANNHLMTYIMTSANSIPQRPTYYKDGKVVHEPKKQ